MKRIFIVLALVLWAHISVSSQILNSPIATKRCAGLILCAGGVATKGFKSYALLGAGLLLVTDSTHMVTNAIKKIKKSLNPKKEGGSDKKSYSCGAFKLVLS